MARPWASAAGLVSGGFDTSRCDDAPVAAQQVAEVDHVDAELEAVTLATDIGKHVLRDAEVETMHERQEHGAALDVFAAMLAEIRILRDQRVPRRGLLLGVKARTAPAAGIAEKFISPTLR